MRKLGIALAMGLAAACSQQAEDGVDKAAGSGATLYIAQAILTLENDDPKADAVMVRNGLIDAVGDRSDLATNYPAAAVDKTFANHVIAPGFIDPHIHMALSSLQYATPLTPPWPMATHEGMQRGLPNREAFFTRLAEHVAEHDGESPLIVYGFHDLVHGDLTRTDLDAVVDTFPLIVWHYSSHDFYLNSAALEWANITPELHETYEGVAIDETGELTGRVFEDAIPALMHAISPILLHPERLNTGLNRFSILLNKGGVTTVAELGYGIFSIPLENANISGNWQSKEHAGYRLYLVPEHRAFTAAFKDNAPQVVRNLVDGQASAPAPVLPQVKFFTDGAFYSQTMRVSPPGYLAGQSQGTEGLWVTPPDVLANTIRPYWEQGLSIRIHSNGDAAQTATLNALEVLRAMDPDLDFVIEHAGLFSPDQVAKAGALNAVISAASHYVFYLGDLYQGPLGDPRGGWITPLNSLSNAGVPVTLHSDAPLAPPLPLRAASVHMTRATRSGGALSASEALSPLDALEAITIDAARALGLEDEIGSIAPGKRADFTILGANPLETEAGQWPNIPVWGVVLDGVPRKAPE